MSHRNFLISTKINKKTNTNDPIVAPITIVRFNTWHFISRECKLSPINLLFHSFGESHWLSLYFWTCFLFLFDHLMNHSRSQSQAKGLNETSMERFGLFQISSVNDSSRKEVSWFLRRIISLMTELFSNKSWWIWRIKFPFKFSRAVMC